MKNKSIELSLLWGDRPTTEQNLRYYVVHVLTISPSRSEIACIMYHDHWRKVLAQQQAVDERFSSESEEFNLINA